VNVVRIVSEKMCYQLLGSVVIIVLSQLNVVIIVCHISSI